MYEEDELKHILKKQYEEKVVERLLFQTYQTDYINRLFYDDYKKMFYNTPFEINEFRNWHESSLPDKKTQKILEEKYNRQNFNSVSIKTLLRKPLF